MSNGGVNEQILNWIKKSAGSDKMVADFLVDLIYEEAEHPGQWWWKDTYKKKIMEYCNKWSAGDAD